MDISKEGPGQSKGKEDDCCVFVLDSSDEEFETIEAGPNTQEKDFGCVVIDSDSDDEPFPEGKSAEVSKTCDEDDILVISDSDESSVIFIDDDSDVESPVIVENDMYGEMKISSIKKEIEEFTISKPNASDDNGEQEFGGKRGKEPEAELEVSDAKMGTDEKAASVVEQPRKRMCTGSNTGVTPAFGFSTNDLTEAKHGSHENGCVFVLDSSDEEFETIEAGPNTQEKDFGCVVIDSDSDDEPFPEGKSAEVSKTCDEDDILVISDSDESSVIFIDDDSDVESPVIVENDMYGEMKISSIKKEIEEFTISKPNASDDNGEQEFGGKRGKEPEAELEVSDAKMGTDEKAASVVEQPRKRMCTGSNTGVTPAFGFSTNDLTEAKHGSHENGLLTGVMVSDVPIWSLVDSSDVEMLHLQCSGADIEVKSAKPQGLLDVSTNAFSAERYSWNSNCNIPGCFFRDSEKSKMYSGKNFNKNKDELVQRIYILMNETVFNNQMPPKINVTWNKKMLRTVGMYCSHDPNNLSTNFGTIQISLKVCDSADRVRDTLIRELCHAATWLLHGIRDAHGNTCKYYARKSNMVHPELPMVTRCHNYKINCKVYYECVYCKYGLSRHTKSLDTKRFMCTMCNGPLSLVPLTQKDDTPIRPHVRPFAKFVQQHYAIVQYLIPGIKHKQVMRTLGQEFFIMKQILKLYGPHPLLASIF